VAGEGGTRRLVLVGTGVVAVVAALALAVTWAGRPPTGPVEVPWDAAACAHCRMLVGDPAFAAQLHTEAGEVRFFDDPGCLLLHLHEARPAVHGAWVHHLREDRWIALDEARFVEVERTPMGYGYGAVGPEAGEGRTAEEVQARLLREPPGGGAP
jgi:copper chaperone NosL